MEEPNKIKRLIISVLTAMLIMWGLVPCTIYAAETASLTIQNLEAGDKLEIYRIAYYSTETGKYTWASGVADWMKNKSEGSTYKGLTTAGFANMDTGQKKAFCQQLMLGMKNESDGIASLSGYTLEIETDQAASIDVEAGCYVLLPKGVSRIYQVKTIMVKPGDKHTISYSYEDGDFAIPAVEAWTRNTSSDSAQSDNTSSDTDVRAVLGDKINVNASLSIPEYSDMFSDGKRILNLTLVIPRGMTYEKDSLVLKGNLDEKDYTLQTFDSVTAYKNTDGDILFFESGDGYFYERDGSILVSGESRENAVQKYNELHGTKYQLRKEVGSIDENNEEIAAEKSTETATEIISSEEEELNTLITEGNTTVLIIAFDTSVNFTDVEIAYSEEKNRDSSADGIYSNLISLAYSTSPLDANLKGEQSALADIKSYGIKVTVCKGDGASASQTTEQILKNAVRLTDAEFSVYKLSNVRDGDTTADVVAETAESQTEQNEIKALYVEDEDKTYEYTYYDRIITDQYGEGDLSGLDQDDYLVIQEVYPDGYTRSEESILISKQDWTDEAVMDGKDMLDVVWLDYATVYLPGTGKRGIMIFVLAGTMVCVIAMRQMIKQVKSNRKCN